MASTWTFERDDRSARGFLSASRPSTDARTVLLRWESPQLGRTVDVVRETDDEVVAELTCSESDIAAGEELDRLCVEYGVRRRPSERLGA